MHAASWDGEERSSSAVLRNLWREEEEVLVRLSERSDLPFIGAREGGERLRRELKRTRETKRNEQAAGEEVRRSYSISTTTKRFSFRVTFRISVMRGKNLDIGSFPQPATRRGEASGGGGARVDIPLVSMLVQVGKEPPL